MWTAPEADVRFGDVFSADFLLDLFVRADAVALGRGQLSARQAAKLGSVTPEVSGNVELFSPAFGGDAGFALGHAASSSGVAMLVSDSCAVSTALVQGGRQKRSVGGRLLFVPLLCDVTPALLERLADRPDFGRLPLERHAAWPDGAVAEMRSCFAVDARDVKAHMNARVAALTDAGAALVAARWTAHSCRRGPDAYLRSTGKLARLLAARVGAAEPEQAHLEAADATADALDVAWALEGGNLEDVVDRLPALHADGAPPADTDTVLDDIAERLDDLATAAAAAASAVRAAR